MKLPAFVVSSRNFSARLVLGMLLLNLMVVALTVLSLYRDRQQYDERTATITRNMAHLLERDISAVFSRIDLSLHTVADEVEGQMGAGDIDEARLNAFLQRQQFHVPEVISLRVTDANGLIRYGQGLSPGVAVDLSDREHFIRQRDNPQAGFVIARPVQARIDHEWSIPVSRRLNRADGTFAGIVHANIPAANFVRLFSSIDLGSRGVVALRNMDYVALARYPDEPGGKSSVGQVAISKELSAMLWAGMSRGSYTIASPVDRIERMFSFHRLSAYPLYVLVGMASQDYLDAWWRNVVETSAIALVFFLTSIFLTVLVHRAWKRQRVIEQSLRESEQRWSFALEGGGFAVWDWNLRTGEVHLSKLGKQLFGYAEDEIGNQIADWAARCHPDDRDHVLRQLKHHFRGRTPNLFVEFRVRCKDGGWKWILARGLVVERAADGKPLRMIGTHTDISERHQREEELRLSAAVFNLADEAMVITSAKNEILSVNPAFTVITGYASQEVIGRNPKLLSAKTHSRAFYQEMWGQLTETGGWAGEVLNRKKSGEVYVEWLSIKRVLDEQGQLTHHVAVFSDITVRKATEGRMRHLALHDALTDLPNRALLTERLEQAILRARRERSHLGLMYFDLDKFKPVNDSFGHEVGDLLLKAVASRVVDCVRASDTVARIGGDEFVVLLPVLEADQDAMGVAEKIRLALDQPFEIAGHVFDISASLGLAIYPLHGEDEQILTRHADTAMYQAKKNGRNQVVLYQSGM